MRDVDAEIQAKGARLTVIGNGRVEQAAAFAREFDLPFTLLTDPGRRSYKAAGLRRDFGSTFGGAAVKNAVGSFKRGFRQAGVQGDAWQQGGAFVITPEDQVLFSYISAAGGDHPDPQDLLAALPGAA